MTTRPEIYDAPMNRLGPLPRLETLLQWKLGLEVEQCRKIAECCVDVGLSPEYEDSDFEDALFRWCQSPAERLFLAGFWDDDVETAELESGVVFGSNVLEGNFREYRFRLAPQLELTGDITVDFVLVVSRRFGGAPGALLAIEIDGHDFHERTKEQAASDRQRDRILISLGYRVIRFTGSEIYRNPSACTEEACNIAATMFEEQIGRDALGIARGTLLSVLRHRALADEAVTRQPHTLDRLESPELVP